MDLLALLSPEPVAAPNPNKRLFEAASSSNIRLFDNLLQNGADPKAYVNGFNTLHIATKKKNIDIVTKLFTQFPDIITTLTIDGRSASMIAAFDGNLQILELLESYSEKNTSVVSVDSQGNTLLHYACWGGSLDCAKYLAQRYPSTVNAKNSQDMLPIQFASAGNHFEIVKYFSNYALENGNELVEDSSTTGMNSLHRAAMYGSLETVVTLLVNNIIPANSCTKINNTALHIACQHGKIDVALYLLDNTNIDVNSQNEFGLTALHFACLGYELFTMHILS
jgi:ankyrin repeat protein